MLYQIILITLAFISLSEVSSQPITHMLREKSLSPAERRARHERDNIRDNKFLNEVRKLSPEERFARYADLEFFWRDNPERVWDTELNGQSLKKKKSGPKPEKSGPVPEKSGPLPASVEKKKKVDDSIEDDVTVMWDGEFELENEDKKDN